MFQYHEISKGLVSRGTGAKKVPYRDKRKYHVGNAPTHTRVSEQTVTKVKRTRGGNTKVVLKRASHANVATPQGVKKVKIVQVLETPDPQLTRQNVIVKGAIIQTEIGKAKVTNRPGQEGVVNAVLIQ